MASRGYRLRQFLAWCVHAYTALGLVAAAGIAVLIVAGGHESFRWALVLMLAATLIDATDGVLARAVRTKEVLPGFDGRRLDDLVDYLTYAALPLLLVWRAQIVSDGPAALVLLVPLLASAYGFCQVAAKTDDGYFRGFPSYWNVVAFYLYVLHRYVVPLPGWFSIGMLLGFSLLTFVPTRYVYASQGGRLNRLTIVLGGPGGMDLVPLAPAGFGLRFRRPPFPGADPGFAVPPPLLHGRVVGRQLAAMAPATRSAPGALRGAARVTSRSETS